MLVAAESEAIYLIQTTILVSFAPLFSLTVSEQGRKCSYCSMVFFEIHKQVSCHFVIELSRENEGGRFKEALGSSNRGKCLATDCSTKLYSNVTRIVGDGAEGRFVEKEMKELLE